jgi:PAS domain S-box-containing protein
MARAGRGLVIELDFRLILDRLADAVVMADGAGRIVYANTAAERLLGWQAGSLPGEPLTAIMPARMHAAHQAGLARYLATGVPRLIGRPTRLLALRRDGTEIEIELTLAVLPLDQDGQLFVASMRDLRERVELERQLEVTRLLRAAARVAATLSSRLDLDGVLATVVDALVADFDATLARVWIYEEATHTLHLRASAGLSRETAASSRARIDVATYPYKVGEVARSRRPSVTNGLAGDAHFDQAWVARERLEAMAAFPLLFGAELKGVLAAFFRRELPGELVEVLAMFAALVTNSIHDVQLFDKEQAARAEAEAAVRAREAFLARASHELRTPLTAALGTVRLLGRVMSGALLERPDVLLDIAVRNLEAMSRLVDDLLDASKLGAERERITLAPVEVGAIVAQALETVGPLARGKGVGMQVALPAGLTVQADGSRLEQVLVNLATNAVKFTPPGGTVSVEAAREEAQVVIRVRDTGEGIAREHLEGVFEPFYQVVPRRGRHRGAGGVGLGLAICRQIVALHGGTIRAESEGPGRGSTFTVRLPAEGGGATA